MKITDTVLSYAGENHPKSTGICRLRVFAAQGGPRVLITDLGECNDGPSVTNAIETIIKRVQESGLALGASIYIEHYEKADATTDTFDQVDVSHGTQWKPLSKDAAIAALGCSADELEERTGCNKRIVRTAEALRLARKPFDGSPWPEPAHVTKRKLKIFDGMISAASVDALVQAGSGERELQRLLKQDLSIMAEGLSSPEGEYICFSELPLGDGYVDFAVFTGRSRMDVILIEVKGADFNLLNSNHYQAFNHKVQEAAGQLRDRVGVVYRNYDSVRRELHRIRLEAERGSPLYNAFLGPVGLLQVDPDKDINIRSIVIGGRTQNDREESRKRQDYELNTSPRVRLESWDTWLRRLQRA
ncbi:Shedu immune nuclease family protein [Stenotrophomonas maltophilia]|uniref:Shedu immune nuclease family protein n=1 Tax=Stenotrophomonas maltophilia TaxID=40324 RepID=UPI0009A225D7|nr:Shedu immune nuclease family protein [Stenotrophomonas maltophilia]